MPYNFIYPKPVKGTPFRQSLPVLAIIGRTPSPLETFLEN